MKLFNSRIAAVFAALLLGACASMERIPESAKTFDAVYEANGADKNVIYNGTKLWIAENFRSAQRVIDLENQAEGILIAKGVIGYPCEGIECIAKGRWNVRFTMRIDTKDQRFKLTFSNLSFTMPEEVEVWQQGQLDAIKPRLLEIGPQIQAALAAGKQRKEW